MSESGTEREFDRDDKAPAQDTDQNTGAFDWALKLIVKVLATVLTLGVLALSADLFRHVGISLYTEQYIAALLAIAMLVLYLHVPAGKGRARTGPVPWYDLLAAVASFACALYVAVKFPTLSEKVGTQPWDGLIVAGILVVLVAEGLRRTSGATITIVAVTFFVLALFGGQLPGTLAAKSIPLDRLTFYAVWDSSAGLGLPMTIVTTVVVVFVFFGQVLFKSGGSAFFTDISMALLGRYRGGPAKISIVGSSLFGTISGSTVANVLTVGVVTIPLMKRSGFRAHLAGAIEATASTGGQLMPPVMGIAAFIMAEFLQVPYADVALAAVIPAVLFYVALFIQVDLEAARTGIQPLDEKSIPRTRDVLKAGWYFPVPFAILIYTLFWLGQEAEVAGLWAAASALVLAILFPIKNKRIGWADLYAMLRDTGLTVLDLFMIGMAAGIIIGTLNYSGLGFTLTLLLLKLAGGNMIALLVIAGLASIILGMGMPTVGVYILLATLIAPALIQMNIEPMAAHMFILYYGCLSMITPPVAIGAFAAANLAAADPMRTGLAAMRFGWPVFVIPFLYVFSPTLLMQGSPWLVAVDFIAAIIGVWLISAGIMGYSVRLLDPLRRLFYGAAGFFLLLPMGAVAYGRWINLLGVLMALALMIWGGWFGKRLPEALAKRSPPGA